MSYVSPSFRCKNICNSFRIHQPLKNLGISVNALFNNSKIFYKLD
ncbi:hypothetical protein HMPREF9554_00855 [Treponema phagedenis F0421]|nr:hypothetical protein HMPREF9554_00855 [Treponema phagedenis F0421]